jgi:putative (di)nucleoside polyphosphate hydrolase
MALTELARFLPRGTQHNRYLRAGMRPHHRDEGHERDGPTAADPPVEPPSPLPAEPRLG